MSTISTLIITKNEAHDIEACIESVLWTDEIIILDCGSTDNTIDICKKYAPKVKLHQTDKKASFARALTHACWKFIKIYFINLGFLDGWPGFILAFSNFEGTFYKYVKPLLSN